MLVPDVLNLFHHSFVEFARGGGGGSGGGGGGGAGGSGGSGGGGALALIAMVGYAPMHPIGALVRKAKNHEAEWVAGQVIGWAICAVFTLGLLFLSVYISFYAFIMAAGAPIGMGAGLYGWFGKLKQSKKVKAGLDAAAQKDDAWNEEKLIAHAKDIFMRYQRDWTNNDAEAMKAYMTPAYQYHASLMVYALKLAARQDKVNNPVISQVMITNFEDSTDDSKDWVTIGITAQANDVLVDTRDATVLFVDNSQFTEFYRFQRSGNDWLLSGIQEATASAWSQNQALEQFAVSQGYCFSLDWGWLLLPRRGQLFGESKFGTSDINNHVIGVYNNCLIQIYTYIPGSNNSTKTYLIAQTNVPKSYGDIVVRRKTGFHLFGIRGLKKVTMEWREFNDKYEVFASDEEQVTSFELLHPVFMEKLEALPFQVNIEVVDNVVYLYAPEQDKTATVDRYQVMLGILREAFVQMKL